ncbi:sigma 54-interacting transcriptional regulator [Desulfobotulus sp. H1]|uniref:Sigma 54-interacting transcriptional regulator n=1 Tax=Desulfobotulus pelophilus TaxID=2823377 RepID=A0ABT3NAI0_9BACT|nr:sigma 54-interacting transcriptional regulator [Desulfobotulus pelophilus]MCW7753977.1 sigma 54-interacting transcriptional regulator [Desulfobotulus pelophilus]
MPIAHITKLFQVPLGFQKFLDNIPMGVVLTDHEKRIVCVNHGFEALTGFSAEYSRGLFCQDILRSRQCVLLCPARQAMETGETQSLETDIISRDRQRIPVRITIAPLHDDQGKFRGILESLEDLRPYQELGEKQRHAYSFSSLVGRSPQMEKIFQILPVLAQSDASVLITGETGTGKDLVAEALHQSSERARGPFIKVNCGALPETLLESELFGHMKGAFTGALENKPGRFRLAHGGTLFLTEIGDLPLSLQVKLLTFLDDRIIYPLGSTRGFPANVRIVAATHRNLEAMVRDGCFRQDLLFRLNVARVHLPPLREREDDIRLLLDHFLNIFNQHLKKNLKGYAPESLKILLSYPFAGNVRELRNIVEYAVNVCPRNAIEASHLPAYLTTELTGQTVAQEVKAPPMVFSNQDRDASWNTVERQMILNALIQSGGRKTRAAALLGWGRSTLWRKIKQYGIDL